MSARTDLIIVHLEESFSKLLNVLTQLRPEQWEQQIQDEDQLWTVRQIVAHVASAQKGMTGQIVNISQDKDLVPEDFDLNRWNQSQVRKAADRSPQDLMNAMQEDLERLKETIKHFTDEELDKRGRHGSLRIMSVEEIARTVGSHNVDHATIIAEKLGLKV